MKKRGAFMSKNDNEDLKIINEVCPDREIKYEDVEIMEKVNAKKKLHKCDKFVNIKDMINQSAKKFGDKPAFRFKTDVPGKFNVITFSQFLDDINCLGTKLINMGRSCKKIAIIGDNRYEWCLAYMAIAVYSINTDSLFLGFALGIVSIANLVEGVYLVRKRK